MKENDYLCNPVSTNYCIMNIKEKIKEKGFTMVEVADRLGVSQANFSKQVSNLENNIAVNLLIKIADVIGVSVSELIGDTADFPEEITMSLKGQQVTYKKEG